jgi:hypothetical protein
MINFLDIIHRLSSLKHDVSETSFVAHPVSYPVGTLGPFPGVKRGRAVTLTIYPQLVPRSEIIDRISIKFGRILYIGWIG